MIIANIIPGSSRRKLSNQACLLSTYERGLSGVLANLAGAPGHIINLRFVHRADDRCHIHLHEFASHVDISPVESHAPQLCKGAGDTWKVLLLVSVALCFARKNCFRFTPGGKHRKCQRQKTVVSTNNECQT